MWSWSGIRIYCSRYERDCRRLHRRQWKRLGPPQSLRLRRFHSGEPAYSAQVWLVLIEGFDKEDILAFLLRFAVATNSVDSSLLNSSKKCWVYLLLSRAGVDRLKGTIWKPVSNDLFLCQPCFPWNISHKLLSWILIPVRRRSPRRRWRRTRCTSRPCRRRRWGARSDARRPPCPWSRSCTQPRGSGWGRRRARRRSTRRERSGPSVSAVTEGRVFFIELSFLVPSTLNLPNLCDSYYYTHGPNLPWH